MNQNKDKYAYFLSQCNKTPYSKDWRAVFGEITEETLEQFDYEVQDPNDYKEALRFAKLLDNKLTEPMKFFDSVYKAFCENEEIPHQIIAIIDEVINDEPFQLLVKKERGVLKIPIDEGHPAQFDISTGQEKHALTPGEDMSVKRLCFYAGLTGKLWYKFFKYLLVYNYLIPITKSDLLDLENLSELVHTKLLNKTLDTLCEKMEVIPLRKRQINLVSQLLNRNENIVAGLVDQDNARLSIDQQERKISRDSKTLLRELLQNIYPLETSLAKSLESIKRRRLRTRRVRIKQLKDIKEKLKHQKSPATLDISSK